MAELVEALCRTLRQAQGSLISVSPTSALDAGGVRHRCIELWAVLVVRRARSGQARATRPDRGCRPRSARLPPMGVPRTAVPSGRPGREPRNRRRTSPSPVPSQPPPAPTYGSRNLPESSPDLTVPNAGKPTSAPSQGSRNLPRRLRPGQHHRALDHESVGNRAQRGRQHCGARQRPTRASRSTRPKRAPPSWTDIRVVAEKRPAWRVGGGVVPRRSV
jgi:hypothetical protein